MSGIRNTLAESWLRTLTGVSYAASDLYIGAIRSNGAEVSGGGYARVSASGLLGTAQNGEIRNVSAIAFPVATGNWGGINRLGLFTASTGGSTIFEGAPEPVVEITTGQTLTVRAGNFAIKFRDGNVAFNIEGAPDQRPAPVSQPCEILTTPIIAPVNTNFTGIFAADSPFSAVIPAPT